MNVHYDNEVGALYIKLGDKIPDGVVELSEGVNLDTTEQGKLVGIQILQASMKIDMDTPLSYSPDLDKNVLLRNAT